VEWERQGQNDKKNKKGEKNSDVKKDTNLEAKDRAKDLQLGQGQDQSFKTKARTKDLLYAHT